MGYILIIGIVGILIDLYLEYRKLTIRMKKEKEKKQAPYTEHLEKKVHLFKFGINGKDDVEAITFKNLEVIKDQDKIYSIVFILFPDKSQNMMKQQFDTLSPLRDLSQYPRKLYNMDADIQQILFDNQAWAITGELTYKDNQIIFSGVALREEKDDDNDGGGNYEGEGTPVLPKREKILV